MRRDLRFAPRKIRVFGEKIDESLISRIAPAISCEIKSESFIGAGVSPYGVYVATPTLCSDASLRGESALGGQVF